MTGKNIDGSPLGELLFYKIFSGWDNLSYPTAFSIDENKEVNIFELEKRKKQDSKKCNCVCLYCGAPMLAIFPKNRTSYFRHYDPKKQSECMQKRLVQNNQKCKKRFKSLQDLWNLKKQPFIATSPNGWLIIVDENPEQKRIKNNGKYYTKANKSLKDLIIKNTLYFIKDINLKAWTFVCLYN